MDFVSLPLPLTSSPSSRQQEETICYPPPMHLDREAVLVNREPTCVLLFVAPPGHNSLLCISGHKNWRPEATRARNHQQELEHQQPSTAYMWPPQVASGCTLRRTPLRICMATASAAAETSRSITLRLPATVLSSRFPSSCCLALPICTVSSLWQQSYH